MAQQRNTISILSAVFAVSAVNDLLDNCRECSTNWAVFFQNKANSPAVQNQRKLSYSKGL